MKNFLSVIGVGILLAVVAFCGLNLPCNIVETGSASVLALFVLAGVFLFYVDSKKDINRKEISWKIYFQL